MARIGQIEALKRLTGGEADTFEMLGEDLELRCKPSGLDALEWTALASEQGDATDDTVRGEIGMKMAGFAHRILKKSLTAVAYQRFSVLCDENELGLDVVFATVDLLLGSAAGRPTVKPSDSSAGQSTTSTSSSPAGLSDDARELKYRRMGLVPISA